MAGARLLPFCIAPLLVGALAAAEPAARPEDPAREYWLQGLLSGRDLSGEAGAYAKALRARPDRVTAAEARSRASFRTQLNRLRQASDLAQSLGASDRPWLLDRKIGRVQKSLDAALGAQREMEERVGAVLSRVTAAGLGAEIVRRAEAARGLVLQHGKALRAAAKILRSNLEIQPQKAGEEVRWRNSIDRWLAALEAILEPRPGPPSVLRALPYAERLPNPGPLILDPDTVPSYADAQAGPGGPADLTGTPNAPLSQVILARAAELQFDYIAIYNFVRQDIRTEYYAGALKGAEGVLASGAGNDVDQASLLIGLLRAARVPARYVQGVIELPLYDVAAPLGLPPERAIDALNRAGIAHDPVIRGGQVAAVRLAHTWVSAYVPYANYRGAAVDLSGPVWLPLAPAAKAHGFAAPALEWSDLGVSADAFSADYLNANIDATPLQALRDEVTRYLTANPDLGSYGEQLTRPRVTATAYDLLPSSLPFDVVVVTRESVALAPDESHQLRISIPVGGRLGVRIPVADLLGHRVTLSYAPATVEDYNAIREFGGMALVPAYLVELRPQISIDGRPIASGSGTLPMGLMHRADFELVSPAGTVAFERTLVAGSYAAIGVGAGTGRAAAQALDTPISDDQESRAARLLSNLAAIYSAGWDQAEDELASLTNVAPVRPYASVALVATEFNVEELAGLPFAMQFTGVNVDAATRSVNPLVRAGGADNEYDFLRLAGLAGSQLEAQVFADQWVVEAISADEGIRLAALAGFPPVEIDAASAPSVLPTLNHPAHVIDEVQSWVDAGYRVLMPPGPVSLNAWTGSVWHVWDERSGGAGYFISGGYAGGQTSERIEDWLLQELVEMLANPYGDAPNNNPLAAVEIVKVTATDFQIGVVDQPLERPLAVLIRDVDGRPVSGTEVAFRIVSGDAELVGEAESGTELTLNSDRFGIAQAPLRFGPTTAISQLGREAGGGEQPEQTRFGEVIVAVNATSSLGPLQLEVPFTALARPEAPDRLEVVTDFGDRSMPRGAGGDLSFRVLDRFGNPVSNVPVEVRGEMPNECGVPIPAPPASFIVDGDCPPPEIPGQASCAVQPLNAPSGPDPKRIWVVQGDGALATAYPITVSATGLAEVRVESANIFRDVACASPDPVIHEPFAWLSEAFDKGRRGGSIEAALPGEPLPRQRRARLYSMIPVDEPANGLSIRWAVGQAEGNVVYDVDPLGDVLAENAGGGEHLIPLAVGGVGDYPAARRAEDVNFQTREDDTFLGGFEALVGPLESAPIFAASARVVEVDPDPLELSSNGYLLEAMKVHYEVQPEGYRPEIEIRMYEDGSLFRTHRLPTGPNVGVALFPPGLLIDIEKDYELEIVLSAGSVFEIRSERFPVPVTQSIVKRVNNLTTPDFTLDMHYGGGIVVNGTVPSSLYLSNHIDIPNQLVCENRDFSFELSIPATVTITAARLDDSGSVTGDVRELMPRTSLDKGEHLVEVTATELGTGDFLVLIDAESGVDSSRELIPVGLRSRFELVNSLPVGHAMVKGVDLSDGAMVLSRQDIEVPGLGANLKFVRTYSSNGRFTPGALGSGWSHNYLSRVIQSHCGDFTVTGAEGGSMRFVRDGTGFRALKGYHGALVQNADSSFDFYPKGGNRYHFVKRQSRVWWLAYIEDPNGNRTTFSYVDREVAPLIRQVTDASGRSLIFEYQYREFDQLRGDVLTRVRGPGGIELNLEYDPFGNQIRAARENDSLIETYDYRVDAGTADRHLLKSATDVLTGSTRQYFYHEQTLITPVGSYPLDLSASSVASIIEPDGGSTEFAYTPGPGGTFTRVEVSDARSQVTAYDLNVYGAATRITAPNGVREFEWETATDVLLLAEIDENGRRREFRHDQFGNVIEERIGANVRSYSYHPPGSFQSPHIKNRVATYTNWRGLTTRYDYDLAGNLITETLDGIALAHTYDSRGNRLSATDGNGNATFFGYDVNGYLTSQTDPEGNRTEMKWDARGRKTEETDANGTRMAMAYDDRDRVLAKTGPLTLAAGAGTSDFSEQFVYDDARRRRTEIDRNGNETVYDHDAMGRLTTITNALGDTFEYGYDGNGNKLSERDWLGRETTFEYDAANRLIRKLEPEGKLTTYAYDPVGNLIRETMSGPGDPDRVTEYRFDPDRYFQTEVRRKGDGGDAVIVRAYDGEGNMIGETDPLGRETTYAYDAYERRTLQQGPLGSGKRWEYDAAGNMIGETTFNTPADQTRQFLYDRANRQAARVDAEGGVSSYEYDGNGNVIREVDPNGNATTFTYNESNLVLTRVQPFTRLDGAVAQALSAFEYDANGNLVGEVWPNGNRIAHDYDALNRKTAERDSEGPIVSYGYDAAGNVIAETDGNGNTSVYRYDGLNRRVHEQRPLGRDREFAYTSFGELKAETDAGGNQISHTIDRLGRRVRTVGPLGLNLSFEYDLADNLTRETDSRGTTMSYQYNELNQRITETVDGMGQTFDRAFTYDLVGNRRSEADRRGILSEWNYDRQNRLVSFRRDSRVQEIRTYDAAGNLLFLTDANGHTTGYRYDQRNLVIEESRPELQITRFGRDAAGDVVLEDRPGARDLAREYDARRRLTAESNGAAETTSFEYDANNNQTARIRPESAAHRWLFRYDAANRLAEVEDRLGNLTRYDYDGRDNRVAQRDANGRATAFEYDARNRLTAKVYPDGARIEYGYDANNNLRTVAEPNGNSAEYAYDALNRQIGQVFQNGASRIEVDFVLDGNGNPVQVNESVDGATTQTMRDYDRLDRLTRVTDRFGQTLQYAYDDNGNRTVLLDHQGQRTEYRYDALNRLDQIVVPGVGLFDYVYQSDGLLDAVIHPNGSRTEYQYDGADRIDTIDNTQAGEIVTRHDYDYDRNGNRIEASEQNGQGIELTRYQYDLADRLTAVTYPDREVGYTLDPVGNRTEERITDTASNQTNTRTYVYNPRDQLTRVSDTAGLAVDYAYDPSGNQIQRTRDGQTTTFAYSPRNRMIEVTPPGGEPIRYAYDHNGMRVEKEANGTTTRFVNDDTALIAETNVLGNTLARYHYGSDRLLAETRASDQSFFLEDSLGTPVALTTRDGTVQTRYTYDAWGNLTRQQGASEQPFGFTGYQRDEKSDLYYAQQRYYDAFTGRFTREDPFQGDVITPPSLHRYLYANANPTAFVDPTGNNAEAGHAYVTSIIAEETKFTPEEVQTLAFFSQLPDEVDELDAFETQKAALKEGFANIFRPADTESHAESAKRNFIQSAHHALTGGLAQVETDRTVRAIRNTAADLRVVGILIHRLADTFAHRQFGNESLLYPTGPGHARDGTSPDIIQRRPDLFERYARTLTAVLAQIKGIDNPGEISSIADRAIGRLRPIIDLPLVGKLSGHSSKRVRQPRSNATLERLSVRKANEILRAINQERIADGRAPLDLGYEPENFGLSHFTPGVTVTLEQALQTFNSSNTMLNLNAAQVRRVLESTYEALSATEPRSLEEAERENRELIIMETNTGGVGAKNMADEDG